MPRRVTRFGLRGARYVFRVASYVLRSRIARNWQVIFSFYFRIPHSEFLMCSSQNFI